MNHLAFLGLVILALIFTDSAWSFPELTRHGYSSCTSCHVAPNGGGALNPYGRNLARELLSTWGGPREAEILHGALPKSWMDALEESKLRFGGDVRSVQTHRENKTVRSGRFFVMQAQVEAVYDQGPWAVALSLGKIEDPMGQKEFRLVSQRFYGMLRFGEKANFRVGRFNPAFGLNLADHTLSIRRPLGLEPQIERDNAELSWIGESDQFFASFVKSVSSVSEAEREQAGVFRYEHVIGENSRVGASVWRGDGGSDASSTKFTRTMFALHSIVNISRDWFATVEVDRQERGDKRAAGETSTSSQYGFLRVHYEPYRGVVPLIQYQREHGDLNLASTEANKFGAGFNFYPSPHFEIFGIWNRVSKQSEWSDEAYLLLHYYL